MLSTPSIPDLAMVIDRPSFANARCSVPLTHSRASLASRCQGRCSRCSSTSFETETVDTNISSRPSSSTTLSIGPVTPDGSIHGLTFDEKHSENVSTPPPYDASTIFDKVPRASPKKLKRPAPLLRTVTSSHEITDTRLSNYWDRRRLYVPPYDEVEYDELPPYKCTVYKMGYAHVKREMTSPDVRSRWRCWRKYYVELWGTMLRLRHAAPSALPEILPIEKMYSPLSFLNPGAKQAATTVSLAGADAVRALDYSRRPYVLRFTTAQGEQFLLRLKNYVDMISWIEHLQAGINISTDIESRPMPKFLTLPSRAQGEPHLSSRIILIEQQREERRRNQQEALI